MSGVKPRLKLLAMSNLAMFFILGPLNITKLSFVGTLKGDFGVKAPPQTCQQSIFRIMMAIQINPSGQSFGPLNMNNRPGLKLYSAQRLCSGASGRRSYKEYKKETCR